MPDHFLISRLAVNPVSSITVPLFFLPYLCTTVGPNLVSKTVLGLENLFFVSKWLVTSLSRYWRSLGGYFDINHFIQFLYIYNLIEFWTNWKSFSTLREKSYQKYGKHYPKKCYFLRASLLSFRIILQSSSWRNNWTKNIFLCKVKVLFSIYFFYLRSEFTTQRLDVA